MKRFSFRARILLGVMIHALGMAHAGSADLAGPPTWQDWQIHRDTLAQAPSVTRFYSCENLAADTVTLPNLSQSAGSLTARIAPSGDRPPSPMAVVEGRWPEKTAARLDQAYFTGPAAEVGPEGFTALAWIRLLGSGSLTGNNEAPNGTILAAGDGYWSGWRITLSYPNRRLSFEIGRPQPSHSVNVSGGIVSENTWHLVAATWDGQQMRLYLDGVLTGWGEHAGAYHPPANQTFRIGYANAGVGSLRMDVDEVVLYQRALGPEEILQATHFHWPMTPAVAASFHNAALHQFQQQWPQAERALAAITESDPVHPGWLTVARLLRAHMLGRQMNMPGASRELVAVLETDPAPVALQQAAATQLLELFRLSPHSVRSIPALLQLQDLPQLTTEDRLSLRLALGHAREIAGDGDGARGAYRQLADDGEVPPALRTLALFQLADSAARAEQWPQALAACDQVAKIPGVLPHHTWEAQEKIRRFQRVQAGLPPRDPAASRVALPPRPEPGRRLHVAREGDDQNPGTAERPFASLERARQEIRALKQQGELPAGGVAVLIGPGTYPVRQTFELAEEDSGTAQAPIIYQAAEAEPPVFSGGIVLSGFEPVQDEAVRRRLPESARDQVRQVDLKTHGLASLPPLVLGGFASGHGFRTHPVPELFFNGQALPMARWPNQGMIRIAQMADPQNAGAGRQESKVGRFLYEGDRPVRWMEEKDAFLYGYWFWDWADSYERIQTIDPVAHSITLAPPYHRYGYRQGARYYAVHLLSEIDQPGEWHLDRQNRLLYFYPPSNPDQAKVELSLFQGPMIQTHNLAHVRFERLTWELGAGDAVKLSGGSHCLLAGCTIRHFGGNGVEIDGGSHHGILSCDIYSLGRGGTLVSGGDRKTLTPGHHYVENCHIHHLSRIDHTYTPAVLMSGVGHRITHNLMSHIHSSAIRLGGNDHLVELNEIHDVLLESDDQGGADMWGNATYRGNVYRYNYWHHIGHWQRDGQDLALGQAGIRLDDAISGTLVYGNVFYRSASGGLGFGGVQIHGGKDNWLDQNLFADCAVAVSFSPWGQNRWDQFVASALDAREIDPDLYRARYPELNQLSQHPDVNYLWRNLVWRCGQFLHRNRGGARLADNSLLNEDPGFAGAAHGDFTLKPESSLRLGLPSIPFEEIGLYPDRFRPTLPLAEIQAARAQ